MSLNELTDAIVKCKLEESCDTKQEVSYEDALSIVRKKIRLDANEPDAAKRVIILNASYVTLSKKHGWTFKQEAPKAAIRHIMSVLQTPVLKKKVDEAVELDHNGIKNDYKKLMRFLKDKAVVCEEFNPLRAHIQSKNTETPKNPTYKDSTGKGGGSDGKGSSGSSGSGTTPKKKTPPCLVQGNKEDHFVKDGHSNISEEAVTKLVDEHKRKKKDERKAKQADKAKVSALSSAPAESAIVNAPSVSSESSDESAVIQAEINGFKFACRIDSGADKTCISDTIVDFLFANGVFLLYRGLSEQFQAFDGRTVQSKGKAQMCPLLRTSAGPCRIRNVEVNVTEDTDMYVRPGNDSAGEIVLGNSILKRMGWDVKEVLADNIDLLSSTDFGDLPSEEATVKVGKLGLKLVQKSEFQNPIANHSSKMCMIINNGDFWMELSAISSLNLSMAIGSSL